MELHRGKGERTRKSEMFNPGWRRGDQIVPYDPMADFMGIRRVGVVGSCVWIGGVCRVIYTAGQAQERSGEEERRGRANAVDLKQVTG